MSNPNPAEELRMFEIRCLQQPVLRSELTMELTGFIRHGSGSADRGTKPGTGLSRYDGRKATMQTQPGTLKHQLIFTLREERSRVTDSREQEPCRLLGPGTCGRQGTQALGEAAWGELAEGPLTTEICVDHCKPGFLTGEVWEEIVWGICPRRWYRVA